MTWSADLTDNVTSHWDLDEESGTRSDALGNHDLTDVNSVGFDTGALGNAAKFTAGSQHELYVADHADFQPDGKSLSFAFWATWDTAVRSLFGKYLNTDYEVETAGAGTSIGLWIHDGAAKLASNGGGLTAGNTYFVACGIDEVLKKAWISVNGGAKQYSAVFGTMTVGSPNFALGSYSHPSGGQFHNGLIDEFSFFSGYVLTDANITELYNSGTPLEYGIAPTVTTDLRSTPGYPAKFDSSIGASRRVGNIGPSLTDSLIVENWNP